MFLKVPNQLLEEQIFLEKWKRTKIALIWKGNPMELSSCFRPTYMICVVGEFFRGHERDYIYWRKKLRQRIRKEYFTLEVINTIVEFAKNTLEKWFVVIAMDK